MHSLLESLIELIRRTSAEIPDDVHQAILRSLENEKKGTIAASALQIIERNIELAKAKSQPICQDTGSVLFLRRRADRPRPSDLRGDGSRSGEAGHQEGVPPAELGRFADRQERRHQLRSPARPRCISTSTVTPSSAFDSC
jgi:hypothetical protein